MPSEHPGVLTAHHVHHVSVQLAEGGTANLTVEDVQYLAVPHDRFLHAHNPIARHFFVQATDGWIELVYNPGRAGHAVHGFENIVSAMAYSVFLARDIRAIRSRRAYANVAIRDLETGEMENHSYRTTAQIWDGATAARNGYHAVSSGTHFFQDLRGWAHDNPQKGYYIVHDGHPQGTPVILHEIRRHDLTPA